MKGNTMKPIDIDPMDKKLPFDTALEILDLADKENWCYAPIFDGCYDRADMEQKLKESPDRAISLGINYVPDNADFVDISLHNGKLVVELNESHYYDCEYVDSINDIKKAMFRMIEKSYA